MLAWPEMRRLVTNCRAAKSVDALTERVVADMGGWTRFGFTPERELPFLEREFIERYEILMHRHSMARVALPPGAASGERIEDGTG